MLDYIVVLAAALAVIAITIAICTCIKEKAPWFLVTLYWVLSALHWTLRTITS